MKEIRIQQWSVLSLLLVLPGLFAACSVDPKSNPFRLDAKACAQKGDKLLVGAFCVDAMHPGDAGQAVLDAGSPGVDSGQALTDAGQDAGMMPAAGGGGDSAGSSGSMMPQAGTGAACDPDAGPVPCYDAKDKSTALQSPCHNGGYECKNGVLGTVCKNEVIPTDDFCNGIDDDCDGKTDEATSGGVCTSSDPNVKGACRQGHALCRNSALDCISDNGPASETCNGIDDDCDGNVDEDTATKCYPTATSGCSSDGMGGFTCQGACASGVFACVNGKYATTCSGAVTPQAEVCTVGSADAVDENCDGVVDEGCNCTASAKCYTGTPASTAGVGPCKKGDRACTAGHFDATCTGEVTPQPETCANEGSDSDCNGVSDDVAIRGTSCSDTSTAKGLCKTSAVWKCVGTSAMCVDGTPSTEVCDRAGQDENCDGHVNEGFNLQTDVNNCGACGNKCSTGSTCCSGNCVNTTSSNGNCGSCGKACSTGKSCCASSCINPQTDINNCGTCGNMCGLLGLLASCKSGACGL